MPTVNTNGLGAGRYIAAGQRPPETTTTVHELETSDGAKVRGVLSTVPGASTVVCLMHPRQDVTHHPLVPGLLAAGAAVWTQHTRSVNNDLTLIHEQALLDVAAGMVFLRDRGFDSIVPLGHSGGGTLYAYYLEQAGLEPAQRIAVTPGGRPSGLAEAEMPTVDGAIFLAPHPGQGKLLLGCIDPSVTDEFDPMSVDPDLNAFDPANGFAEPPQSSTYSTEFAERYRAAQRARVQKIDDYARESLQRSADARRRYATTKSAQDKREAIAPRIMTVYRTDADLRTMDLTIDPNDRPYGSVMGRRPDLINYGFVGFGRLTTPEAWLSTWSGISSNAAFARCAPGVRVPTLFIELTGDQSAFPTETAQMVSALGAEDRTHIAARGTHFGGAITAGEPTGNVVAGAHIADWLETRFALAPITFDAETGARNVTS
ncbi:alpha/beta hydrolase [Nocardia nova]|uniref:alpha/beta hydrolase n=1 Tax=Nocardia nova TaxID=37330 RepID=UPI003721BF4A